MTLLIVVGLAVLPPAIAIHKRALDWRVAILVLGCGALLYGGTGADQYGQRWADQFHHSWQQKTAAGDHK